MTEEKKFGVKVCRERKCSDLKVRDPKYPQSGEQCEVTGCLPGSMGCCPKEMTDEQFIERAKLNYGPYTARPGVKNCPNACPYKIVRDGQKWVWKKGESQGKQVPAKIPFCALTGKPLKDSAVCPCNVIGNPRQEDQIKRLQALVKIRLAYCTEDNPVVGLCAMGVCPDGKDRERWGDDKNESLCPIIRLPTSALAPGRGCPLWRIPAKLLPAPTSPPEPEPNERLARGKAIREEVLENRETMKRMSTGKSSLKERKPSRKATPKENPVEPTLSKESHRDVDGDECGGYLMPVWHRGRWLYICDACGYREVPTEKQLKDITEMVAMGAIEGPREDKAPSRQAALFDFKPKEEDKCTEMEKALDPRCQPCHNFDKCKSHDPLLLACTFDGIKDPDKRAAALAKLPVACQPCEGKDRCLKHDPRAGCYPDLKESEKSPEEAQEPPKDLSKNGGCLTCGHRKTKKTFRETCPRLPDLMFKGGQYSATRLIAETENDGCLTWIPEPEKPTKGKTSKKEPEKYVLPPQIYTIIIRPTLEPGRYSRECMKWKGKSYGECGMSSPRETILRVIPDYLEKWAHMDCPAPDPYTKPGGNLLYLDETGDFPADLFFNEDGTAKPALKEEDDQEVEEKQPETLSGVCKRCPVKETCTAHEVYKGCKTVEIRKFVEACKVEVKTDRCTKCPGMAACHKAGIKKSFEQNPICKGCGKRIVCEKVDTPKCGCPDWERTNPEEDDSKKKGRKPKKQESETP